MFKLAAALDQTLASLNDPILAALIVPHPEAFIRLLWISLAVPYTYVYDGTGDKTRSIQFTAAGVLMPTSLFFTPTGRLLVTPGCYEFDPS